MSEITTTEIGDALYTVWHKCWDACQDPDDPYGRKPTHCCYEVITYPIAKVTATRIYFHGGLTARERERTHFIDRAKFDADGRAYHRALRATLYLDPAADWRWRNQVERLANLPAAKTVSELRREMADAHPDRGGDRESFQAARDRYLAAREVAT